MANPCELPDILFYLSDQHNGLCSGYSGHPAVQTPNLDRVAAQGTVCGTTYTSCPLCVPARSSLLTGRLTSQIGVYGNAHTFSSDQATFLHSLGALGYETVLCGRMHFVGADQRHGFSRRIADDITPCTQGASINAGTMGKTYSMGGCTHVAAAGRSPVLEYDSYVISAALDYLRQDHDRPQCLVIGTYGPHFPYIAPPEFFQLYDGQLSAPPSWDPEGRDPIPFIDAKRQRTRVSPLSGEEEPVTTDIMLAMRSAYFGMIQEQDRLVGQVRESWETYLKRRKRRGIFVYSSDHGDTCGEHGVFGKQTFYEGSTRIPLIFEGAGIPAGQRLDHPASIMDIGPTLCGLTGADTPPVQNGRDLSPAFTAGVDLSDRPVFSEWVQLFNGRTIAGRMVRSRDWKLIYYHGDDLPDLLFNLHDDPHELVNRAPDNPDMVRQLTDLLMTGWAPEQVTRQAEIKNEHLQLQHRFFARHPADHDPEKWTIPHELRELRTARDYLTHIR